MNTQTAIQVAGVNKWYGAFQVLKGIDLAVHKGERIVICGPSPRTIPGPTSSRR